MQETRNYGTFQEERVDRIETEESVKKKQDNESVIKYIYHDFCNAKCIVFNF